jgi:hypothetical protein
MVMGSRERAMSFGQLPRISILLASLAVAGCASATADKGFEKVASLTEPHTKEKISWL